MKNKLRYFRLGFLIFAIALVIFANGGWRFNLNKTAYAVGELAIDWGVPSGDPIFVVDNLAPGDPCEMRTVNVNNTSALSRDVAVRGIQTDEVNELASVMEIEIVKVGTGTVYGPETLEQFFTESVGPNAVALSTHASGIDFDYEFSVCFPESAGDEFQNASVVFDLQIGINIPTPEECLEMEFVNTIFGTAGNDRIRGTSQPDLIFGLEGNDRIDGGGGDDCIVGGEGNDRVNDSTGQDVVVGGAGNDDIDSGSDDDLVVGNDGNDKLAGGSGNDQVFGNFGEDKLEGGSGADELHGGEQNDLLEGGGGQDQLFGESGNDNLKGGSDNDFLDGGSDTNVLNGDSGKDTCINGPTRIKCEIP